MQIVVVYGGVAIRLYSQQEVKATGRKSNKRKERRKTGNVFKERELKMKTKEEKYGKKGEKRNKQKVILSA